MRLKKWRVAEYDKELAKNLAAECDIDPIVALIASSRGYTDPTDLEEFLGDEPCFSDPAEMADIICAAEIINAVIENGEKIAVFGDYDCDGVTATALLYSYLKSRNAECIYYIPDRFTEGYGMNCSAVQSLAEKGVKLIVTVDNGIKCFEEIALANKLGITVVVTDHHLPDEKLPEAAAVVDPHRKDCPSVFKEICGAQVAFALVCVLENKEPEELIPYFADILSLAVMADIMPLTLENRSIVKYGIEKIKNSPVTGISALLNVAGIAQNSVNASKIAFGLTPRINAAGRMGKAERAVELLVSEDIMQALNIANEIDDDNSKRQTIEKKIFEEAVNIIENEKLMYDRVIVVAGDEWHHGVVGIAAARITERYGAPTILLSRDGEICTGSGRSIEGFSLYDAINTCSDLLLKFGGHDQAAGITLKSCDVDLLRSKINEFALTKEFVVPTLKLDCKLNPAALSLDLAFALEQLEPFGYGNPTPVFGVYGVTLQRITPIGNNKHLRLLFTKGENSFQALLFGIGPKDFCFEVGDVLDLAVNVESNCYKGNYAVSVQIRAIRPSNIDDDKLFRDVCYFNDYFSGKKTNISAITPTREEVGTVYKFVYQKSVLPERVRYIFTSQIGYAKTEVALMTLEELGLISRDANGMYFSPKNAEKTALTNSLTYKNLIERSSIDDTKTN